MCGIAGFLWSDSSFLALGTSNPHKIALDMADRLRYRGPDGSGEWVDTEHRVALAHRRLSVIDVSLLGRQPMGSASGRYWITFNGEIYNYRQLRQALDEGLTAVPPVWKGGSDTEVMLAAFERWGIEAATKRFHGMFAFAVWDRSLSELTLVRSFGLTG